MSTQSKTGSDTGLRHVGVSAELHARLYQCEVCRAYWEELEHSAQEITLDEADALQEHRSFERDAHTG